MQLSGMFKQAVVRKPCPQMIRGLSSSTLGLPDYAKALDQHAYYVDVLKNCGLKVQELEALLYEYNVGGW